jgi:hypothetical protein
MLNSGKNPFNLINSYANPYSVHNRMESCVRRIDDFIKNAKENPDKYNDEKKAQFYDKIMRQCTFDEKIRSHRKTENAGLRINVEGKRAELSNLLFNNSDKTKKNEISDETKNNKISSDAILEDDECLERIDDFIKSVKESPHLYNYKDIKKFYKQI